LDHKLRYSAFHEEFFGNLDKLVEIRIRSRQKTTELQDSLVAAHVLKKHIAKQGQLPWPFSEFHELADVQEISANASVGLRLEADRDSKNCDIVASIRSVPNQF